MNSTVTPQVPAVANSHARLAPAPTASEFSTGRGLWGARSVLQLIRTASVFLPSLGKDTWAVTPRGHTEGLSKADLGDTKFSAASTCLQCGDDSLFCPLPKPLRRKAASPRQNFWPERDLQSPKKSCGLHQVSVHVCGTWSRQDELVGIQADSKAS